MMEFSYVCNSVIIRRFLMPFDSFSLLCLCNDSFNTKLFHSKLRIQSRKLSGVLQAQVENCLLQNSPPFAACMTTPNHSM